MRILITTECYVLQTGGVSNVVLALENGLRERNCEVRILTLSGDARSRREGDRYYIRSFPAFYYPGLRVSFAMHDPLLKELLAWRPDLIHIHTEGSTARMARAIAEKTGAPIVMTTHTDFAQFIFGRYGRTRPVRAMCRVWGRHAFREADTIVVPSEKARTFPQLNSVAERVTVIPNGIRLDHYQKPVSAEERTALLGRYGFEDNGKTLVMVTRVSREKNIKEILRMLPALLRELPEAQLLIVGDGPYRSRLEEYCAESGLTEHVRFTGMVGRDEVYRYYALGDVFVSASTFEVHSMSYLEAMAAGLPLVCREDMSLLGVLENGKNGYAYRTEREFTEDVTRILRDGELRTAMREEALRRAELFSDRHFVDRTLALYGQVCARFPEEAGGA